MTELIKMHTVETYRVECPHGCPGIAVVTINRSGTGEIVGVKMECFASRSHAA